MLDWLIIGGGIHGAHCAHVLTSRGGIAPHRIRIHDPHLELLACWRHYTTNTGMAFLRSPEVHNLDLDPMSLYHFARSDAGRPHARFANPYNRPALSLFQTHVDWVIQRHSLTTLHLVGRATGLTWRQGGIGIETTDGALAARRVLLAIGHNVPFWPDWAQPLRATGAAIHHVFDAHFTRAALPAWRHAVIIGGGLTAVQTALALAHQAPGTVTLLSRHAVRVHQFDSDPCWIGPKCQNAYHRNRDMARRRALLREARHRGSVPPDVAHALRVAIRRGTLAFHTDEVIDAGVMGQGNIRLTLAGTGEALLADQVVLATGFHPARPGGLWLAHVIADLGLACGTCGYPIVDSRLCWHAGLHVTGALAELETGPVARNIIGARLAAGRLLAAA